MRNKTTWAERGMLFFLILLAISSTFLIYRSRKENKELLNTNRRLAENSILQVLASSAEFDVTGDKVLQSTEGPMKLMEVITRKVLVYRFTENQCSSCYEAELKNLKKVKDALDNRVVIIASFSRALDFINFKKKHDLEIPIFNYVSQLSSYDSKSPYYFTIGPNFDTQLMFTPDYTLNGLTNLYFDKVLQAFQADKMNRNENQTYIKRKLSRAKFSTKEINLGVIRGAKAVEVEFPFTNIGREPIVITKISSSCGCTIASWDRQSVGPLKESKIKAVYKAEHNEVFKKEIFVFMNTADSPVRLNIKGQARLD